MMRVAALLVSLMLAPAFFAADDYVVQSDAAFDFSTLKTFAIRTSTITTSRPELNNSIVVGNVTEKVRASLVAKKLIEATDRPDVFVDFNVAVQGWSVNQWGHADKLNDDGALIGLRGRRGPGPPGVLSFIDGEIVLDLIARDSNLLVWRGVFRGSEPDGGALAQKLAPSMGKMLSDFPPAKSAARDGTPAAPLAGARTFGIRNRTVDIDKPELNNRLFIQEMERAVVAGLTAKGLKAVSHTPDALVDFKLTGKDYNEVQRGNAIPVGRGRSVSTGPSPDLFTEATLLIDLTSPSGELLWRGTFTDQERSGPALAKNLPKGAKSVLADYPNKKR